MNNFLLKELWNLKVANNIPDEVFRRILKTAHEKAEDKESYILKDLFNGEKDSDVLNLFSRLYETKAVNLKDFYEYEEYLKLVILRGEVDLTDTYLSNLVVGERMFRKYSEEGIKLIATTRGFLNQSTAASLFENEVYGVVSSMDQQGGTFLNRYLTTASRTKEILTDERINLSVRKVFLRLVNGKNILFDNESAELLYNALLKFGYNFAEMLFVMIKDERIRNNQYVMEFVRREENISLLSLAYIVFTSESLEEKDVIELLNIDDIAIKIEKLKALIKKYYKSDTRVSKEIKAVMSKTFKNVYNLYLNGEMNEEDFRSFVNINKDVQNVKGAELKVNF